MHFHFLNDSLLKSALETEQRPNPSKEMKPQKTRVAVPMKVDAPQIDIDYPHVSKTSQTTVSSEVEFKTNADKLKVLIEADVPNRAAKLGNDKNLFSNPFVLQKKFQLIRKSKRYQC